MDAGRLDIAREVLTGLLADLVTAPCPHPAADTPETATTEQPGVAAGQNTSK